MSVTKYDVTYDVIRAAWFWEVLTEWRMHAGATKLGSLVCMRYLVSTC